MTILRTTLPARRAKSWGDDLSEKAVLLASAAIFVAVVGLLLLWGMRNRDPKPSQFAAVVTLVESHGAGNVFYGTVDSEWSSLTAADKVARAERLRQEVKRKGFRAFVLMDGQGFVVARWIGDSVSLVDRPTGRS